MNLLVIHPLADQQLEQIAGTDRRVNVIDARGWFDDEYRATWPSYTVQRYVGDRSCPETTREERDSVLQTADIVLAGWPYPLDVRERAPKLRWFHQLTAGANNVRLGDLWGSDVIVTTSRGYASARPIAEYVMAGFLHFARGFQRANSDQQRAQFTRDTYRPILLKGKTACVVGTGGIGREVAHLCVQMGMRVVGTRRRVSYRGHGLPDFSRVEGPSRLHELLAESEFVAICCQWTPETTSMIDERAFAAMKPETVFVNVARAEIVDEEALIHALDSGAIRGAVLDVYTGETEHDPDSRLWSHERVLITPHISGGTDVSQHRGVEFFCENLRALIDGRELENVIDWGRGY